MNDAYRVIVFILSVFLLLSVIYVLCVSSSYVHFKETDQMDLNDVANEFVGRRIGNFGNF